MLSQQKNLSIPAFDLQVYEDLLAALGNDVSRVNNLFRKFIEGTATRLDEIRRQSATEYAASFHALKGSASMVGAGRLAAAASKFQDTAPGMNGETLAAAIEELETELEAFRVQWNARLGGLPPHP
jgi:HPt (histidine-containing phosphotransfer) domain-containing protein